MRKFIITVGILVTLFIFGFAGWLAIAINNAYAPGPLPQTSLILIEKGQGVSAIASTLKDTGVISSSLAFKILTRLGKAPKPLKAGEYEFPAHVSAADVLKKLQDGDVYVRKLTVTEGMTSWQVVESLRKATDLSGDIAVVPPDGTLLPQTYLYTNREDRNKILADMKAGIDKTVASLWPARDANLPFQTESEALTLASIVEKETGVASERKRVAGVFINRLRRGIPLQSDPTIIYGLTNGEIQTGGQGPLGRRLLTADLEKDTPYNTYLRAGLPPTPIANPGAASIEAVLHPEQNDYLFFVADGTGGHVFSKTLEEHNRNVAKWRKFRKTSGQ